MNIKLVALLFVVFLAAAAEGYWLGFERNQQLISRLEAEYDSVILRYDDLNLDYAQLNETHKQLQAGYIQLQLNYSKLASDNMVLSETHQSLILNHTSLRARIHALNQTLQNLISKHKELNVSYQILARNHTELRQGYTDLSNEFETLEQDYTEISDQYTSLFGDYGALLKAFNDPLSYEEVPSIHELKQWLTEDKTDEIKYTMPNFVCGDFSVMLAQHAKLKNWDMGIVAVYGHRTSNETFAHAINAITCDEGLVYVEPQRDEVWWYEDYEEITEAKWLHFPGFGSIYVERYEIIVWYE